MDIGKILFRRFIESFGPEPTTLRNRFVRYYYALYTVRTNYNAVHIVHCRKPVAILDLERRVLRVRHKKVYVIMFE